MTYHSHQFVVGAQDPSPPPPPDEQTNRSLNDNLNLLLPAEELTDSEAMRSVMGELALHDQGVATATALTASILRVRQALARLVVSSAPHIFTGTTVLVRTREAGEEAVLAPGAEPLTLAEHFLVSSPITDTRSLDGTHTTFMTQHASEVVDILTDVFNS